MSETNKNDFDIDLGSAPTDDFDPFASDDDFGEDTPPETPAGQPKAETPATKQAKAAASKPDANSNPIEIAINEAELKEQQGLFEKPPIFSYAGVTEDVDDVSKSFDELRIEKSADFPELEDGKRVSWTVEYGKITKNVGDPKGTSIGKMKAVIEKSKEFIDSLKKTKDKNPVCKIKPKVVAQSKGTIPSYKGVFTNMGEAEAAGKVISIVPARDGKVYEIRNTEMGRFITPVAGCEMLSDVRAGFNPALPLIPMDLMMRIVAFFRYYMRNGIDKEVLVNVYWDKQGKQFLVDAPAMSAT